MAVGAVSYKSNKKVKTINIEKDKTIVNALMKTKREENPNYEQEYQDYLREEQQKENAAKKAEKIAKEKEEAEAKAVQKAQQDELNAMFEVDEDEANFAGGDN